MVNIIATVSSAIEGVFLSVRIMSLPTRKTGISVPFPGLSYQAESHLPTKEITSTFGFPRILAQGITAHLDPMAVHQPSRIPPATRIMTSREETGEICRLIVEGGRDGLIGNRRRESYETTVRLTVEVFGPSRVSFRIGPQNDTKLVPSQALLLYRNVSPVREAANPSPVAFPKESFGAIR